jgi:hypothetical protein
VTVVNQTVASINEVGVKSAKGKGKQGGGGLGEFFVPSQDAHGHSARIDFRAIPALKRNIAIMLASHGAATGWQTESDFMRWAVYRALDEIAAKFKDGELSNYQRQINAIRSIMDLEAQLLTFNQVLADAESYIKQMVAMGAKDQAKRMLLRVESEINKMDDNSWRKLWKKEFKARFGEYVKGVGIKPEDFTHDPEDED